MDLYIFGSIYSKLGQNLDNYKGQILVRIIRIQLLKVAWIMQLDKTSYYGRFNVRVNNLCPGSLKSHVAGVSATVQNL